MSGRFILCWDGFARLSKYQWVKDELEYLFKRIPAVGGKLAATAERIKDSLKYMLVSGMFLKSWALRI